MSAGLALVCLQALTVAVQPPGGAAQTEPARWETVQGGLRPASALFGKGKKGASNRGADRRAFRRGLPGGVVTGKGYVLLLVDGRVLERLRAAQPADENNVRVRGVLHDGGRSMTPFRIEYRKDGEWFAFDLPFSGTSAPGVQGGDE